MRENENPWKDRQTPVRDAQERVERLRRELFEAEKALGILRDPHAFLSAGQARVVNGRVYARLAGLTLHDDFVFDLVK